MVPFTKQLYNHATPFEVIYRFTLRHIVCSELMGNNNLRTKVILYKCRFDLKFNYYGVWKSEENLN